MSMGLVLFVIAALFVLIIFTRVPLGLAMLVTGFCGLLLLAPAGGPAFVASGAGARIMALALSEDFTTLVLFILMGVFVVRAGLADDLYLLAVRCIGHLPGGLGLAAILACGGFAALSGSSSASAATMARVCVPDMREAGYDGGFSAASVAAGGTMGILIPPSGALIVYALLSGQSLGALFAAGVLPGLVQMIFYLGVAAAVAMLQPARAPAGPRASWAERAQALSRIWGVLALMALVVAGLVAGVLAPREAAGLGAAGAFLFALARGRMTPRIFASSLREAGRIAAMIFVLGCGAVVLAWFAEASGLEAALINAVAERGLSGVQVLLLMVLLYLVLGAFLDGFAILFLTVPLLLPLVTALGFDLVWWGIVSVVIVEISLITPPVGVNVYILKAVMKEVPIQKIFGGIMPFFAVDVLRLVLLLVFPAMALWLGGMVG